MNIPDPAETPLLAARRAAKHYLQAGASVLDEGDARAWLGALLPFGPAVECSSVDEAVRAAKEIGFPVVIKALSPELLHKTDHGLVEAGCKNVADARRAAIALMRRSRDLGIEKSCVISVQRELSGVEIAIGAKRDGLGTACVVAAGGTLMEIMQDAALQMSPVDGDGARAMLRTLRCWPLLDGYRGRPRVDVDGLAELIREVSELAVAIPEIEEIDLNPVFVDASGCTIADACCVLSEFDDGPLSRLPDSSDAAIEALLHPKCIAIVGASNDHSKVGGLILRYLRKHAWSGEVVAINRHSGDVPGVNTFRSLEEASSNHRIDLSCIAVPAASVEEVVKECVELGIPAGIIYSAGFAEAGEDGKAAQRRLYDSAAGRFRFVGPNSIGLGTPRDGYTATFGMALEDHEIPSGPFAFVSQSGAIASSMISRAAEFGVGFSHWISTGNEADLEVADFINALARDEATSVICLFLEVVRHPRAFAAACAKALGAGKPILALKSGLSEAGGAAVRSHTGAVAGSGAVYSAFLRQCGVIEVSTLSGLLSAAQGLYSIGPVPGKRVAVVSMSGGACAHLADKCADADLILRELSAQTQGRLREVLPSFATARNPVDITAVGIARPELVGATMEILRDAGEADVILLQLSTNADPPAEHIARTLVDLRELPGTPFLVGRLGSPRLSPTATARYIAGGMHVFSWPEQLVEACRACVEYGAMCRVTAGRVQDEFRPQ